MMTKIYAEAAELGQIQLFWLDFNNTCKTEAKLLLLQTRRVFTTMHRQVERCSTWEQRSNDVKRRIQ